MGFEERIQLVSTFAMSSGDPGVAPGTHNVPGTHKEDHSHLNTSSKIANTLFLDLWVLHTHGTYML